MGRTIIKLVHKEDVHRVVFESDDISYNQLLQEASELFDLSEFRLKYLDDENELITVASDRDVREAIEFLREESDRIPRLEVRLPSIPGHVSYLAPAPYSSVMSLPPSPAQGLSPAQKPNPPPEKPFVPPVDVLHHMPVSPPAHADRSHSPDQSVDVSSLNARLERDVDGKDGDIHLPGAVFLRSWQIKNNGDRDWPPGCCMSVTSNLGHVEIMSSKKLQNSVPAGTDATLGMQLRAPRTPGHYVLDCYMTYQGQRFGRRFWVDFVVDK